MKCSTPANEDPYQGEMPKVRSPSISKKIMAAVVGLHMKPQIRSKEQLKCMHSKCLDDIGEFKDFEYHCELHPNKPRVQTPHKVVSSVELSLKKRVKSD